jgi:hypothetical protein
MAKRPKSGDGEQPSPDEITTVAGTSSRPHKGHGNIHPLGVRNILTRGQAIPFVIRWQKNMNIDFTNYIVPTMIPYHLLAFWTGVWDPPPLQNLTAFERLLDLSLGFELDYSDLTIELFAVTKTDPTTVFN